MCLGFWMSANAYTNYSANLGFTMRLFYWGFCWNILAHRFFFVGHLFGILALNERIDHFSVNLSFIMHLMLGPPLQYDCLGKIIFWACVWDSGFRGTHIQLFGESQFYNTSFLLGPPPKYDCLGTIIFWACVWDSGLCGCIYTFLVNLSFIMHLFYWGFCWNIVARENQNLGMCLGFWMSADAYTNSSVNLSLMIHLFYGGFCLHMPARRKLHLGMRLGFWISANAYTNCRWISML